MKKAIKNKGFESYKKVAVSLVIFAFSVNQVVFAAEPVALQPENYVQTQSLAESQNQSVVPVNQIQDQTSQDFLGKTLTLSPVVKKTDTTNASAPQGNDYEAPEYSFDDAVAQLTSDYAAAVIVKSLTASDLQTLVNHPDKIEIGVAIIKGKTVLFTSGSTDEIRVNPAAEDLLSQASLIAHTHPAGASGQPSLDDFEAAGDQVEYVIGDQGVFAYNHDGLISNDPISYTDLANQIQSQQDTNATTTETREVLNQFIQEIDAYNQDPSQSELLRSAGPTVFPGLPQLSSFDSANPPANFAVVQQTDPTQTDDQIRILHNTYNTTSGSFGGSIIAFNTPADLSAASKFTFDFQTDNNTLNSCGAGLSNCVKVEFVDSSNRVASVYVTNITNTFKQYDILKTTLSQSNANIDYTQIKQINFVIDNNMVAGKNNGFFDVRTGGLYFQPTFVATTGPVTNLTSYGVVVNELEPQGHDTTSINQTSSNLFQINYNLANGADGDFSRWSSGLLSFATPFNLNNGDLVLSLKATGTTKVKIDLTSGTGANAKSVSIIATGVTNSAQFFHISKALVDQAAIQGFDTTNITFAAIVVDDNLSGSKTATGTIEVGSQGLNTTFIINPDGTNPNITFLPVTSTGARPEALAFSSFNPAQSDYSNADVATLSQTFFQLNLNNYNDNSYAGIFLNYDNGATNDNNPATTSDIETINLNTAFPNGIVLQLDNGGSDVTQARLEVTDINGNRDSVILNNIESFGKKWSIATNQFDQVDITKISTISLVIEGRHVGGKLNVDWGNFFFVPPIPADGSNPAITPVPAVGGDAPALVGFASTNPNDPDPTLRDYSQASVKSVSATFQQMSMDLYNTFSYGGAFVTFDNPATAGTTESININTIFSNGIVLGLDNGGSDITEVELELTDINGKRDTVTLTGIENFGKRWKVLPGQFDELDGTHIVTMTILVKGRHIGGKLNVDWGNFAAPQAPDTTGATIQKLPVTSTGARPEAIAFSSGNPVDPDYSNADVNVVSQTFLTLDTNTYNSTSYAGIFLNYDNGATNDNNPATTSDIETINLNTAFPNGLVFQMDNGGTDITEATLEVTDINGNRDTVQLGGIQNFGQNWKVAVSQLNGIDVTKVQTLTLLVFGRHVGGKLNVDWGNFFFVPPIPADGSNPAITPVPAVGGDAPALVGFASTNPNDPDPTLRDYSQASVKSVSATFQQMSMDLYNTFSYGGAFVTFDNPATAGTTESININTIFSNGIVLGLDNGGSDITEVELELTDINGKRDTVTLTGIENFGKRWKVLPGQFDELDGTHIVTMTILVKGRHIGGKLNVDWGNFAAPQAPDTTGATIQKLPVTSTGARPEAIAFSSGNPVDPDYSNADVNVVSQTFLTLDTNTYNSTSYAGIFLNYDNGATNDNNPATTSDIETINLNTAFPNGLVFQMDNGGTDITEATLEVTDINGNRDTVQLGGIQNFGQNWKVAVSQLNGIDVTKVQTLTLLVFGRHVGGKLNVDWGNFFFVPPIPADGSNPGVTFLPLNSNGARVPLIGFSSNDPQNGDFSSTTATLASATFAQLNLNLFNTTSYGGAFINYDDFNTPGTQESINLNTAFPNGIVLGLDNGGSDVTEAVLEVTDSTGKRDSVKLSGIESFGKQWKVLASQFDEVDITKIVTMTILVTGRHVGGKLNVDWGLFDFTPSVTPDASNPAVTTVPLLSTGDRPTLSGFASYNPNDPDPTKQDFSDSTVAMSSNTQGKISMNLYNTFSYGGAYINYDNPATAGTTETINLNTAFSNGMVLGLKTNDPSVTTVKLQVTDINGNRDEVTLVNVGTTEQKWKILPSLFDQVDRTQITTMTLLVEGQHTGLDLSVDWGEFFYIPAV